MSNASEFAEKRAMTNEELRTYAAYVLGTGAALAGIGLASRGKNSKERANKDTRSPENPDTITVNVNKSRFMEGLPSPEQFAAERAPVVVQAAESAVPQGATSEVADVAALKKGILRGVGRKLNFFGKAAESDKSDKPADSEETGNDGSGREERPYGDENSDDGPKLLRNELGQFMSPRDPAAAEETKEAADRGSITDVFTSPGKVIDTAKRWAVDYPLQITGGTIASIYLAKKIIDIVNEHRKPKSEKDLEASRDSYVAMLQGDGREKDAAAEEDRGGWLATYAPFILGASWIVPGALGAMIANRVLENRKEEKRQKKEESNSFPDEPTILYKTSSGDKMKISPETALGAILVKQAMIESVERMETEAAMAKSASVGEGILTGTLGAVPIVGPFLSAASAAAGRIGSAAGKVQDLSDLNKFKSTFENGMPTDKTWELIGSDKMNDRLYDIVSNMNGGGQGGIGELSKYIGEDAARAIISDPRLQDIIVSKMDNSKYAGTWGKLRDDRIKEWMQGQDWIGKGAWGDLIRWLASITGLDKYYFNKHMGEAFANLAKAPAAKDAPSGAQGANKPKKYYNPTTVAYEAIPEGAEPIPQAPTYIKNPGQMGAEYNDRAKKEYERAMEVWRKTGKNTYHLPPPPQVTARSVMPATQPEPQPTQSHAPAAAPQPTQGSTPAATATRRQTSPVPSGTSNSPNWVRRIWNAANTPMNQIGK